MKHKLRIKHVKINFALTLIILKLMELPLAFHKECWYIEKKGVYMNIKKVCADGTRILSDFEEINKLLEDGWIVIEYGGISIKSGDGGIEYIPQLFAFRLKKKDSSNVIKQNWKEIIKDDYLKMTFDEIIENQENISSVFSTIHKSEADRKMNEGWTILDERKIHKSSSATKYTLIF